MRDEEIITLFFERSEQAIEALRDKYGVPVRCVARNILGSRQDAEECENDTYLGCWNSIPPHRPDPLKTYVCRIARNFAVTRYHSNTAQKRNSFDRGSPQCTMATSSSRFICVQPTVPSRRLIMHRSTLCSFSISIILLLSTS